MPVPRRFDRRLPERDTTRINERIRVPEVRVIGDDGNQVGILSIEEALRLAQERDLDLVEVAPEAKPPVCRILDYSKYRYEIAQKQKAARKHQQKITIREIKFRPKIAEHDYATKKGHVQRFLRHKDKVKVTIMFRGRETTHPERGQMILDRLAEELEEMAVVEQRPNLEGRNMTMVLGPSKALLRGELGDVAADGDEPLPEDDSLLTDDVHEDDVHADAPDTSEDAPDTAEDTPETAEDAVAGDDDGDTDGGADPPEDAEEALDEGADAPEEPASEA